MLEAVHANSRTMLEETGAVQSWLMLKGTTRCHFCRTKREMMRTMKMKMERRRRRTQLIGCHWCYFVSRFCLHNNGHCEIMRKLSESLFLYVCSFLVLKSFVNCLWPGVCIKPADLFTCVCMMMDAHLLLIDFVSPDNAATGQEGRRR